jgi:hypothetical protein
MSINYQRTASTTRLHAQVRGLTMLTVSTMSPASSTTEKPGSDSRAVFIPRRTPGWSSTKLIAIVTFLRLRGTMQRQVGCDLRAESRARLDCQVAVQKLDSFLHSSQSA